MSSKSTSNLSIAVWSSAAILRLLLVIYGEWQDRNMPVAYTDVDYLVYTDAARHISENASPFDRHTYRYTPLLAFMMLPCEWVHFCFGKLLFVFSDLVLGALIYRILRLRGVQERHSLFCTSTWLFNPFSFTISSRGNADVIICLLVVATLYCFLRRRLILGSFLFGLAVHFKIYPIVFAPAIVVFLDNRFDGKPETPLSLRSMFTRSRLIFFVISAATFLGLLALFYFLYGWVFVYETYLYHLVRRDNRHNFSVYFYHLYLGYESPSSLLTGLLSFFPQMCTIAACALRLGADLPLCFFAQTAVFVVFNKVCTAQYFAWYHSLLPLLLPASRMSRTRGVCLFVCWLFGELHWLIWGYQLEMESRSCFAILWSAGIAFFWINVYVLLEIISTHDFRACLDSKGALTPLQDRDGSVHE